MGRMLGRKERTLTYLGPDTEVLGDMRAKGQVRIDGLVRGSVLVEGELEVGPTGRVEGGRRACIRAGRLRLWNAISRG